MKEGRGGAPIQHMALFKRDDEWSWAGPRYRDAAGVFLSAEENDGNGYTVHIHTAYTRRQSHPLSCFLPRAFNRRPMTCSLHEDTLFNEILFHYCDRLLALASTRAGVRGRSLFALGRWRFLVCRACKAADFVGGVST